LKLGSDDHRVAHGVESKRKEASMHPIRWAAIVVAVAVAACDPTGSVVTGICCGGVGGGTSDHSVAFIVQPSDAAPGDVITPAVQVAVRDTLGNTDPNFVGSVSVALGANPSGAFLDGTTTVDVVSGVARFADLSLNKVGSGFTLVASATGATSATSSGFAIAAPTP
jgi:hypothetical protein